VAMTAISSLWVWTAVSAKELDTIQIPEVYFYTSSEVTYCVVRVNLSGAEKAYRKRILLDFVRDSYDRTDHWTKEYILSAIDYVNFSYLHLVIYEGCSIPIAILPNISQYFSNCKANRTRDCESIETHFIVERTSALVKTITKPYVPITLFGTIRGEEDLSLCTIKVPAQIPENIAESQSLTNNLLLLQSKYRMSIIDIRLLNDAYYMLLTRQCDQKSSLFSLMLELLKSEKFDWAKYLGAPNLAPDVSEYKFSETGKR
jgi:hypothetical protein